MQGHAGSELAEIMYIATAPALLLLICQLLCYSKNTRKIKFDYIAIQYFIFVFPLLLQLMGPPSPRAILTSAALLAALFSLFNLQLLRKERSKVPLLALRQALSAHRGSVMLITCISILAVDFHAFPRRFAKAETYGVSLMDAGVGSIIAASAFAAGMKDAAGSEYAGTRSSQQGRRTKRDVVRLAALAGLGLGRALVTAALDYQNHVSEYGIHWNFFMTLAAVRGLTLFLPRVVAGSHLTSGILGVGVLAAHQGLLSLGGVKELVHTDARDSHSFISANKEGIFSLPGYFALHLLGCACGAVLEETAGPSSQLRAGQRRRVAALVAALWTVFFAVSRAVEPVSRRSCNAAYVLWMLALNAQSLALLAAVAAALPGQPLPRLLQAVNDSMLPVFLVANVLTGGVNLVMDTMAVGGWGARGVVGGYMGLVVVAAVVFQRLGGNGRQDKWKR